MFWNKGAFISKSFSVCINPTSFNTNFLPFSDRLPPNISPPKFNISFPERTPLFPEYITFPFLFTILWF